MSTDNLKELFSAKTNEALITVLFKERYSYTKPEIEMAESILKQRGVELPFSDTSPEEAVNEPAPFMPFVFGIGLVLWPSLYPRSPM